VIDTLTIVTWTALVVSMVIFYYFGRFTIKLMKQHQNIYPILYALEEEEKKKQE
jgi:hypothetical protein